MTADKSFKFQAAGVGLFVLAFVGVVLKLFLYAGGSLTPKKSYELQAVVPNALALAPHADVRQAGVLVGQVERIATRGENAVLLLKLKDQHAPAYRNARVIVRTKGQAGGSDYVALDPGTPTAGRVPSGGVLSISHSEESTQFDQILSTLGRGTRVRLQHLLDDLAEGVGRHGDDLNALLGGDAALTRSAHRVNGVLAADREQTAAFVDDFARVMRALGDRRESVRTFTRRSKRIAEAVAARDAAFRDTLAALPGFLRQTRATTDRLGTFAGSATPVMRNLRVASDELVPAMRLLRPAAAEGRQTMRALDSFARKVTPVSADLGPFSSASSRLTPGLEAFLREINPFAAYMAPYARENGALFANMKSSTQVYDALGHYARILGMQSKSNAVGAFTPEQQQAYDALFKSGALRALDTRGLNPYAKPGGADKIEPYHDTYPRLEADPPYSR